MNRKSNMKKILIFAASVLMLTACDPEGTSQRNYIGNFLNEPENSSMGAKELIDSLQKRGSDWMYLPFSLTDLDVRPEAKGCYKDPVTGSTLQFNLDLTDDPDYSIGTVDVETHGVFVMGTTSADDSFTNYLQPRGNSLYTLYECEPADSTTADSVAPIRVFNHVLLYVYPSGDSIMTTCGHKQTTNLFILQK